MTAALPAAAESARRIVAAWEAYERHGRKYKAWAHYVDVVRDEGRNVAVAFLAMPEVQWRPVLAGGRDMRGRGA